MSELATPPSEIRENLVVAYAVGDGISVQLNFVVGTHSESLVYSKEVIGAVPSKGCRGQAFYYGKTG